MDSKEQINFQRSKSGSFLNSLQDSGDDSWKFCLEQYQLSSLWKHLGATCFLVQSLFKRHELPSVQHHNQQADSQQTLMGNKEKQQWIHGMASEKNTYALFFDGASKGNPGVAGAGGILLDLEGKIEQTYA